METEKKEDAQWASHLLAAAVRDHIEDFYAPVGAGAGELLPIVAVQAGAQRERVRPVLG